MRFASSCLRVLLACLAPLLAAEPSPSPQDRSLAAVRAEAPPTIDGELTDACWQQAAKAEGFTDKFIGMAPADPTEAWLCYDQHYIYVALRARDAQPEKIVATEIKDEVLFRGEDTVTFTIDPFHTHQRTDRSSFTVNARGAHLTEIGAGRAVKTEWKGEWKSAAKIGSDGWTAELAIPWAMLNYPRSRTPVTMGLNFTRA